MLEKNYLAEQSKHRVRGEKTPFVLSYSTFSFTENVRELAACCEFDRCCSYSLAGQANSTRSYANKGNCLQDIHLFHTFLRHLDGLNYPFFAYLVAKRKGSSSKHERNDEFSSYNMKETQLPYMYFVSLKAISGTG